MDLRQRADAFADAASKLQVLGRARLQSCRSGPQMLWVLALRVAVPGAVVGVCWDAEPDGISATGNTSKRGHFDGQRNRAKRRAGSSSRTPWGREGHTGQ